MIEPRREEFEGKRLSGDADKLILSQWQSLALMQLGILMALGGFKFGRDALPAPYNLIFAAPGLILAAYHVVLGIRVQFRLGRVLTAMVALANKWGKFAGYLHESYEAREQAMLVEMGMGGKHVRIVNPITLTMLEDEAEAGGAPIYPDSVPPWLHPEDFHGWPVLAIHGNELHIIAIWSKARGGLTRLIAGAQSAGLAPVIVCPMGDMPPILHHWGWQQKLIGKGINQREEWRPGED